MHVAIFYYSIFVVTWSKGLCSVYVYTELIVCFAYQACGLLGSIASTIEYSYQFKFNVQLACSYPIRFRSPSQQMDLFS